MENTGKIYILVRFFAAFRTTFGIDSKYAETFEDNVEDEVAKLLRKYS
jgi:hypothetical protein